MIAHSTTFAQRLGFRPHFSVFGFTIFSDRILSLFSLFSRFYVALSAFLLLSGRSLYRFSFRFARYYYFPAVSCLLLSYLTQFSVIAAQILMDPFYCVPNKLSSCFQ